jgi:uncharacterized protein (DUF2236 family)
MLPAVLRRRLGLGWTFAQELELRAIAAATRTVTPLLGDRLRVFGPSYVRWRSRRGSSAHPEAA